MDYSQIKPFRHRRIRFLTLFLLAMVMFGNQYAFNNPQALEESISEELNIGETKFDMLYTIFALPNILATFIIGFLIDFLGVRVGIITLSTGVALFQIIVAMGGYYKSYNTMLIGRMLFGIASESLVTAQACFVSFWFTGKQLAMALGLAITVPELGNALNSYLTPIIFEKSGNLGTPLMASVGICTISVICAITAACLDIKADAVDAEHNFKMVTDTDMSETEAGEEIKCSDLKMLKGSFWLIATLCMFAVALYVPFLDNANRLFQKRFCYTQSSAGQAIMITYIVAACFSAPLGMVVDKVGCKRYFIISSMVIFTIAQLIILVWPQCIQGVEEGGAAWGLFMLGIGYCFYANCIVPSIPLVVKKKVTGTAFGIMQMIESVALAFFPLISASLVQHGKTTELGYRHSSLFYLCVGLVGLLLSTGLIFVSDKTKRKLDMSSSQKQVRRVQLHAEGFTHTESSEDEHRSENNLQKGLLDKDRKMIEIEL